MLVFAVKHKDETIRANSRSGGIFTAISDQFLNGGVVYGCILDDEFNSHVTYYEREDVESLASCIDEVIDIATSIIAPIVLIIITADATCT